MYEANTKPSFALYHREACPYCMTTRIAIESLGLHVELRDIVLNPKHRQALITGGGKQRVPCLRIQHAYGDLHWLYESQDIIQYLQQYKKDQLDVA